MTLEELETEANRNGYRLVKKTDYVKFIPCTCGCNRRSCWSRYDSESHTRFYHYVCNRCRKKSPEGSTEKYAKENWNRMILEETNDTTRKNH